MNSSLKQMIAVGALLFTTTSYAQTNNNQDHSAHHPIKAVDTKPSAAVQENSSLQVVFDKYFALKDALVKSDGNTASAKANELVTSINGVQMNQLAEDQHTLWMKVMKNLVFDAEHIGETKSVDHQRDHFNTLSDNMYQLIKVSKQETPVYYQHCPMANKGKGANWLSKEDAIKNPYYGSRMLTCGKTVETIK
ncbi:MAG: DUF3347 domain-containing protein [Sphingobacteriaceae bacterium]